MKKRRFPKTLELPEEIKDDKYKDVKDAYPKMEHDLIECPDCNRSFKLDYIQSHCEKVCKQVYLKRVSKPFDSYGKRLAEYLKDGAL